VIPKLWHVSSRSGDDRLACKLLYPSLLLLYFFNTDHADIFCNNLFAAGSRKSDLSVVADFDVKSRVGTHGHEVGVEQRIVGNNGVKRLFEVGRHSFTEQV